MLEAMPVKPQTAAGRALVRILPQPLYDTEVIKTAVATSQITFYSKPIGQADASGVITSKTLAYTNLRQAAQLSKPYEFDLFSFNLKATSSTAAVAVPVLEQDFFNVYGSGWMEFLLGNRVYLDVPLYDVPHGTAFDGFGTTTANTLVIIRNGVAHRSNAWKFTVGKYLVHIRSTESFTITLNWNAAITLTNSTPMQMYMNGLLYNAI